MRFLEAREWIRRAPAEVFDDLMDYQKLPSRTPLVTGTQVTYTARFRPRDLWHVLVAPLIFVQTRRRMREGVARLKRRLEAKREVES